MKPLELHEYPEIMTRDEVAKVLRCAPSKLARGYGPVPLRDQGRAVLYHRTDVARFIESCRPTSTDEQRRARGGSGSSTEGTSTDALLAQQIEERLNERLAKSAQKLRRLRLAPTNGEAA